jgi:predicted ATPase/DNA-binding CsgD family transcriptional regulator
VRLLTLIGLGGAGKTRLAIRIAEELLSETPPALLNQWPQLGDQSMFYDGVVFVPLASANDASLIAATVAQTIGIREESGRSLEAQVVDWLREKHLLLLLDNFEHLLDGAVFVATLLGQAPNLKVLATSRERLNIRGEHVFELPGLSLPDDTPADTVQTLSIELERSGALQMFVHTARAVSPNFVLSNSSLPALIKTCRLVEGLPLGIELAAAWTRFLSCEEIAHELSQNLDFLSATAQDAPPRHQSLRGVFTHSWELLSPDEQRMLRRLSVFRSSFTRDAAAAVMNLSIEQTLPNAAEVGSPARFSQFSALNLLAGLVDKSLLHHVASPRGARYDVHDILRQYAAEQLELAGEAEAVGEHFALYYLNLLSTHTADLRGPGQLDALKTIDAEIEHIRAAWRWAVAHGERALLDRATDSLFHFYDMRSCFQEGAEAFAAASRALAAEQRDGGLAWVRMLARQGWFTFHMGRQAEARAMLEQSLERLRTLEAKAEIVFVQNYLAAVCSYLGEYRTTYALCQESLDLTRSIDDLYGQQVACNILGQAIYNNGEYATAKQWFQRSLSLSQQIGNNWSLAFSLTNLGNVAYALGEYAEARQLLEEGLRIREAIDDPRGVAICFSRLGDTAVALQEYKRAQECYNQSLAIYREIGNQWGMAAALTNLGRLAFAQGRSNEAAHLLQEALRLAIGTQSVPQVLRIYSLLSELLRSSGEIAWANELAQVAAAEHETLDTCKPLSERILAWDGIVPAPAASTEPKQAKPAPALPPAPNRVPAAIYPAGLTAREVEVLQLVAQGLTDAQVAERLILSRRTVSTHLTSIYSKIHVASRSAATRFAIEQGLI